MKYKTKTHYIFYLIYIIPCIIFFTSCENMITATLGGFIEDSEKKHKIEQSADTIAKISVVEKQKLTKEAFDKGDTAYGRNDYRSAISHFGTVIKLDPTHAEAYKLRAISKMNIGDDEESIVDDLTEAIKLNLRNVDDDNRYELIELLEDRVTLYENLGKNEEARADRAKIEELNPKK